MHLKLEKARLKSNQQQQEKKGQIKQSDEQSKERVEEGSKEWQQNKTNEDWAISEEVEGEPGDENGQENDEREWVPEEAEEEDYQYKPSDSRTFD